MSIFPSWVSDIFGSNQRDAQQFASELDAWIGHKRRAAGLLPRRERILAKIKTIPTGTPGKSELLDRLIAVGESHSALIDQILAHDRALGEMIGEVQRQGRITPDQASEARRRLDIGNIRGLGELVTGILILVAFAILLGVAAYTTLQWRRDTPGIERDIGLKEVELSGLERATDLSIEQARASNTPARLPRMPEPSNGSTGDKIFKGAAGLATIGVVGVGLWAAAKIFGGKK